MHALLVGGAYNDYTSSNNIFALPAVNAMWARRAACAILGLWLAAGSTAAGELEDFNAAAEKAEAHYRVALGYLRTDNIDLAAREIDAMREAWGALVGRFGPNPPAAFAGKELYVVTLTDISTRLVSAQIMIDSGRPEIARQSLVAIRGALSRLRRASGIDVLADCIADANAVMDLFMVYHEGTFDWSKEETRRDIAAKASGYAAAIKRCDGMAPESVRADAQFRRLVDGALAGLAFVPKAIDTRDGELLHRVLGELRAFDNLLAFRYG